jgi:SNF2 family DNA or RNA helicase
MTVILEPNVFQLTDFQAKSEHRMLQELKHFLLYQMGLGKTVVGTSALYKTRCENVLILCPKNAIRVWEDHIRLWFGGLDAVSGGNTDFALHRWRKKQHDAIERRKIWRQRVPNCMNVYIMTYATYIIDFDTIADITYHVIINDEAKRIRNKKSKAFLCLKHHAKHCKYYWPMTGTPGRLPKDFWTMFHLSSPKYYSSYWKFVGAFHWVQKNEWGRQEILGVRNEEQWYRTLNQKASIVTKAMVGHRDVQRQRLFVELDECQQKHYQELAADMMTETPDGQLIIAGTSLERTLRFRQLLVCPKILNPSLSYGSALDDLVETLQDTDGHVVIFTPFVQAFPYIKERLTAGGFPNTVELDGSVGPDELVSRVQRFRTARATCICSILYATSFSLEPADRCFFLGYEWNPEDNQQAEERLNRLTTTQLINAYYYAYEDTYDDNLSDIVCIKQQQINKTMDLSKVGLKF